MEGQEATPARQLSGSDCLLAVGALFMCLVTATHSIGYPASIAALLLGLVWAGRATAGVFFLFVGIKVLGAITLVHGYPGWGGKIALLVGLVLLQSSMSLIRVFREAKVAIFLMLWTFLVLLAAYAYGPRSEYSDTKIVEVILNGGAFLIAFCYLFMDTKVSWSRLGVLSVIGAFVYLAAWAAYNSRFRPLSIFDFGIIRDAAGHEMNRGAWAVISYHRLSLFAAMGFVLISCELLDQKMRVTRLLLLIVSLAVTALIIMWSGARQSILIFGLAALAFLIVKPKAKVTTLTFILSSIAAVFLIVAAGLALRLPIIVEMFDSSHTWAERINRAGNFDVAFYIIKNNPIFGVGLGGYGEYFDVFYQHTSNAEIGRTYAHNLFLELLCETGFVGSVLLLLPWLYMIYIYRESFGLRMRSIQGAIMLPFWVCLIARSMVSSDLIENIAVFAMIGAALSVDVTARYRLGTAFNSPQPIVKAL